MKIIYFFMLSILAWTSPKSTYDIQDLTERYNDYFKRLPPARVHLEFNQTKYSPGDTAYFKAYFLDYSFKPVKGEQYITVQLLNSEKSKVHLQNIKTTDGNAFNQIVFSEQLPAGDYTIEAFSDWMKNFDEQFYYRRKIELAGRRKVALSVKGEENILEVFPEGGKLVANVRNSVLVVSSERGSGTIRDGLNNIIEKFDIGPQGFSRLNFVPSEGERYQVYMDKNIENSKSLIPATDGLVMQVVSLGECSPIQLHLGAPKGSPLLKQELYLISAAYGTINYAKVFTLEGQGTTALIPYRSLRDGLNQIYIMNAEGEVVAERIYFLEPMYAQVEIIVPQEPLNPRDSAEIEIRLSDYFGNPIKGDFELSVTNHKLFDQNELSVSLRNELLLFNDLPQLRAYYSLTSSSEEKWMKEINDLLISQRWRRADWDTILDNEQSEEQLIPYKRSLSFTGKVLLKESGLPLTDSSTVSVYQDNAKIVYSTTTSSDGTFTFQLLNDYWNQDKFYFKVVPINLKTEIPDYYIESEMIVPHVEPSTALFSDYVDSYGEYIHNKRIIDKSFGAYLQSVSSVEVEKVKDPNVPYVEALAGEDVEITISDFVLFPSMEDLVHEVVSGLQYRKAGGERNIRVPIFAGGYTRIPQDDPLFIINGSLTLDTESFLNLVPDEIVYIKLINNQNKLSKFGSFGQNGVVVVLTKEKGLDDESLRSKSLVLAGINKPIPFKARNPFGRFANSIPDLKTTQYWVANFSNSNKGLATIRFKLSDDLGPMQVTVGGVTFDGNPFSGKAQIMVAHSYNGLLP